MADISDYNKYKKKKQTFDEYLQEKYGEGVESDIAPVTAPTAKKNDRKWYEGWFEKGAFEDGYQFGDISKTIGATTKDLETNVMAGVLGMGETAVDTGAYLIGGLGSLFNKDFGDRMKAFIETDLYDAEAVARKIVTARDPIAWVAGENFAEENSLLGERADSLAQSGGQLLGAAALQTAYVPWFVTMGVTSFGGEVENAFNQGANYGQAGLSGAISAAAEVLSEKLFNGINFGAGTVEDLWSKKLVTGISNKLVRGLTRFGIDTAGEGIEEVASQFASNLGSALYREENLGDILFNEEAVDGYIESFIGGAALGGGSSVTKAIQSNAAHRDATSGMTANEEKVFKKVYEARLAEEAEKKGRKLNLSEKNKIYDEVENDLKKGYVGTDTIEEVLGGKTYESYKSAIEEEDALKKEFAELGKMKKSDFTAEQDDRYTELKQKLAEMKEADQIGQLRSQLSDEVQKGFMLEKDGKTRLIDTHLAESYNERARRGQAFEADLSKYDEKQQATVKKAIESGILNNTNRTHELVDMIARISADKGVLFDFTNNKRLKESGFAVDGVDVNGYVTKDGITVNIDSHKSLNSIVGHEITHVLEGTEHYKALQDALFAYAKTKGDYQSRYDSLTKLYKGVEGANVEAELTSDLVGDYLFTDEDFVRHLSAQNRNVFQKIYDEIKYLLKIATTGSKEARELERIKHTFEQVYRESGKAITETKYALREAKIPTRKELESKAPIKVIDISTSKTQGTFAERRKQILDNVEEVISKPYLNRDTNTMIFLTKKSYTHAFNNLGDIQLNAAEHLPELIENAVLTHAEKASHGDSHADGVYTFFAAAGYGQVHPVKLKVKEYTYSGQELPKNIKEYFDNSTQGYASSYDTVVLEVEEIEKSPIGSVKDANQKDSFLDPNGLSSISIADLLNLVKGDAEKYIPKFSLSDSDGKQLTKEQSDYFKDSNQIKSVANEKPTKNADIRFSLSSDSEGRTLSEGQKKYFNGSKVVDDNGNLRVVYHGSGAEFTEFSYDFMSTHGSMEGQGFYFTDSKTMAEGYQKNGAKLMEGYLDIKKPLSDSEKTLSRAEVTKLIKAIDPTGDDVVINYDPMGGMGYPSKAWYNRALAATVDNIIQYCDTDSEILADIANSGAGTEAVVRKAREVLGYDGYIVRGKYDGADVYVAFESNQFKNIDNLNPTSDPDVRRSLSKDGEAPVKYGNFNISGDDVRLEAPMGDVAPVQEDVAENATTNPTVSETEQVAPVVTDETQAPKGDIAPVKDTSGTTPQQSAGEQPNVKQRKWIGTSTDSDAVDGRVKADDIPDDVRYYQPIPNKVTLGNANAKIESIGYESSVAYFKGQFANKRVSLDDIALGERLVQEAVKRGDTATASDLIENIAILGTELGQKVQALSIIKRLTPEGQLRMLQKTVERGKTKGDKSFEGVEITQEMIDHILKTYGKDGKYDQTKLNEAVEKVKKQIADQMKVTKLEKVNAWRYLSMLGNPKTHIRNLVSNVAMRGTVAVKNAVARTIESVAPIGNRTKTWKRASDAVKAFSEKTALDMKDVLSDGGKYSEEASIKAKRDTFKNKVLNKVYNLNSDLLSKEDWWFSKPAFTSALSEYLTANGIETEQDIAKNPEIVAKAKQYATEQSQIATFRQYSWLANKINDIEKHNVATNIAVGAVLPFKKTPINIAKTALNYSPLGFAKTLTYDASQVRNGKMEASELVDHLSQNITGTALTLVGYLLASSGFLNGGGEDDKEGKYDYQLGEQAYSINIGDATFSLSWLSPIAMPLFVGANAYEQLVEGKEWNGDVVMETLAQTLDPLSEMSFLSSLDSVLSSYDSGIQKFAGIAQSAAQSYVTQFIPTLSSQVAAVMDDTKRTTKVAGDSDFKFVDETINNLKYKIPFLRETLEPSTDIWGNEVKQTEDMLTRAFETFIAPYSKREDISTAIDSEIKSLYRITGDDGLIPSIPNNYVNYKNEKYKMSAEEYTAFKKTYGQTAYNLLESLFRLQAYQTASDKDKANMVNKVYSYARDVAKQEFLSGKGVS